MLTICCLGKAATSDRGLSGITATIALPTIKGVEVGKVFPCYLRLAQQVFTDSEEDQTHLFTLVNTLTTYPQNC